MVAEHSAIAVRAAIAALLVRHFSNADRIDHFAWAEQVRRMPDGRRFRWAYAPYLRKMYASLFDQSVHETIFELFSRAGKSEVVLNAIGYFIDQKPRRILNLWPTEKHAEMFSKDNLTGELFDTTPPLNYLGTKASRRTGSNTILHKVFPGGLMNMFGANAPGDMRRAKGNLLYAEEVDAIQESVSDEGDQLAIFRKRGDEFPDTTRVFASYPSLIGRSRIHALLEESDWQQYFVTCAICGGEPFVMKRTEHLRYDKEKPEGARLECPRCKEMLTDGQRHSMMLQGNDADLWRPTREFRGKRGFQANSLLWPHPVNLDKYPGGYLQMLAQQEIDADKAANPDRAKRVLVNTADAEPYAPETEKKPEASELVERREEYDPEKMLPPEIRVITVGADCQQKGRIELEFVGFGEDFREWGLGYKVIHGSLQQSAVWRKLDEWLLKKFKHPLCGELGVSAAFVDSGHAQKAVFRFTRPRRSRRIFAIKGSSRLGVPLVAAPSKIGRPPYEIQQYTLGTHEGKDIIYQRLELVKEKEETEFPVGYMHFPATEEYGEKYFAGLLVEDVTMKRGLDGDWYRFFQNTQNKPNEPLDCRVYAKAAMEMLNPNFDVITQKMIGQASARQSQSNPQQTTQGQRPQRRKASILEW